MKDTLKYDFAENSFLMDTCPTYYGDFHDEDLIEE